LTTFTPNETEAEFYTGIKITTEKEAKQAADKLLNLGIKKVIITLGEKGLFYFDGKEEIFLKLLLLKQLILLEQAMHLMVLWLLVCPKANL
jgi:ribokinase